jgi:hypothetical protein
VRLNLSSTFGMVEMEEAASKIVELCAGNWDCPISYDHMETKYEQNGFLQLLCYGWLRPYMLGGKREFQVQESFVERINTKIRAVSSTAS